MEAQDTQGNPSLAHNRVEPLHPPPPVPQPHPPPIHMHMAMLNTQTQYPNSIPELCIYTWYLFGYLNRSTSESDKMCWNVVGLAIFG